MHEKLVEAEVEEPRKVRLDQVLVAVVEEEGLSCMAAARGNIDTSLALRALRALRREKVVLRMG